MVVTLLLSWIQNSLCVFINKVSFNRKIMQKFKLTAIWSYTWITIIISRDSYIIFTVERENVQYLVFENKTWRLQDPIFHLILYIYNFSANQLNSLIQQRCADSQIVKCDLKILEKKNFVARSQGFTQKRSQ